MPTLPNPHPAAGVIPQDPDSVTAPPDLHAADPVSGPGARPLEGPGDLAARFAALARDYQPPTRGKAAALDPLRPSIEALRQRGASLPEIRRMLAQVGAEVSTDTLSRYLHASGGAPGNRTRQAPIKARGIQGGHPASPDEGRSARGSATPRPRHTPPPAAILAEGCAAGMGGAGTAPLPQDPRPDAAGASPQVAGASPTSRHVDAAEVVTVAGASAALPARGRTEAGSPASEGIIEPTVGREDHARGPGATTHDAATDPRGGGPADGCRPAKAHPIGHGPADAARADEDAGEAPAASAATEGDLFA